MGSWGHNPYKWSYFTLLTTADGAHLVKVLQAFCHLFAHSFHCCAQAGRKRIYVTPLPTTENPEEGQLFFFERSGGAKGPELGCYEITGLLEHNFISRWDVTDLERYDFTTKLTLPETNSSHLKIDGWNTSFLLDPFVMAYFQVGAVSFREGIR